MVQLSWALFSGGRSRLRLWRSALQPWLASPSRPSERGARTHTPPPIAAAASVPRRGLTRVGDWGGRTQRLPSALVFPNLAITVAEVGKRWPYAQGTAAKAPLPREKAARRGTHPLQAPRRTAACSADCPSSVLTGERLGCL